MAIRFYSRKSYRRGKAPRRSRKYRRSGGRRRSVYGISSASNRYSRETSVFTTQILSQATPVNQPVVSPTDIQGVRYASNFVVDICATSDRANDPATPVYWALQFVPQGQNPSNINTSNYAQILQANQFVIDSGVFNANNQRIRISTKYGRNLNSGDRIYLCFMQNVKVGVLTLAGIVSYSIAYK